MLFGIACEKQYLCKRKREPQYTVIRLSGLTVIRLLLLYRLSYNANLNLNANLNPNSNSNNSQLITHNS